MEIWVFYLVDGEELASRITVPDGVSAAQAATDYAKTKGSRHFPYFKEAGSEGSAVEAS